MRKVFLIKNNGGIGILILMALGLFVVMMVVLPAQYSEPPKTGGGGCPIGQKPTTHEELTGLPAVPFVDEPNEIIESIDTTKKDSTFVLIRRNVPVPKASEIEGRSFFDELTNIDNSPRISLHGHPTRPHTVNLGEFPTKPGYLAYYPTWEASVASGGRAYFAQRKIIFFINKDPKTIYETQKGPVYTVDIYVQKESFDPNEDYEKELFECTPEQQAAIENPATTQTGALTPQQISETVGVPERSGTSSAGFYIPEQKNSEDREQLQLQYFLIQGQPLATWSTHCKPAVYLYPPKKQLVNVKVFPQGNGSSLTYTDPLYPEGGWNVEAHHDGRIVNLGSNNFMKQYDYLYFESRVPDSVVQKPQKGWVWKRNELSVRFSELLPKVGLNEAQTQDFIEYWEKALPVDAPYYFVGLIDEKDVDQIEELEITPRPDYVNRMRVYFERLDQYKDVENPDVTQKQFVLNNKFNVVEWGGMVKNDPNHPFTCSQ